MENSENEKETRLHWIRVRGKGEPSFFDAQTDLRKLVPVAFRVATDILQFKYPDDADYKYADACFSVYQIRVAEDAGSSVGGVIDGFNEAMSKMPPEKRTAIYELAMLQLLELYGLFCRRDAAADPASLKDMARYSAASELLRSLEPETAAEVRRQLRAAGKLAEPESNAIADGYVKCMETGERIDHIQDILALYMSVSGDDSWDSLADACDRAFSTSSIKSRDAQMAFALAYPKYGINSLVIEENKENADDEAAGEAPVPEGKH